MGPHQSRKAGVVTVGREPCTALFESEGSQVGVLNEVPSAIRPAAKVPENSEVSIASPKADGLRGREKRVDEVFDRSSGCRSPVDPLVRRDPNEGAEDWLEEAERLVLRERSLEP